MKNRTSFSLCICAAILLSVGCTKQDIVSDNPISADGPLYSYDYSPCGDEVVTTLYAGRSIDVGTLTIGNDEDDLVITYTLDGDWELSETHLFVGDCDDIPLTGAGNPKIGHFPYTASHGSGTTEYTYVISLDDLDDCYCISAHAAVVEVDGDGEVISEETAFGEGEYEFTGTRWGWYMEYCTEACDVVYY